MLAEGHRLRVGEQGIVGYVAKRGAARIVLDVHQDSVFWKNPYLPGTRSEMALPLVVQGVVIGVLDVQSEVREAFGEQDVAVLQGMADQIALSIHRSRLFADLQERIEAEKRAYSEQSYVAWQRLIQSLPGLGFSKYKGGEIVLEGARHPQIDDVLRSGQSLIVEGSDPSLLLPIRVRDHVIGVVDATLPSDEGAWSHDHALLLQSIVEELGQALESAQLYRDAQLRAARDRMTAEVGRRLSTTLDIDAVLQTAVQEIGERLGLSDVSVKIDLGVENR
jgi:GAF domain-containing protein